MTRRMGMLVTMATLALVVGAMPVWAHEQFRVIGTLVTVQKDQIEVKTKEGSIFIAIDGMTAITRDKKKVAVSALKKGGSVVVDAWGDGDDDRYDAYGVLSTLLGPRTGGHAGLGRQGGHRRDRLTLIGTRLARKALVFSEEGFRCPYHDILPRPASDSC